MKTDLTADRDGDTYGRGSCENASMSWGPNCPNFCVDPDVDIMDGGSGMARCPGASLDKFYCMNKNKGDVDCSSGEGVYTLGAPVSMYGLCKHS